MKSLIESLKMWQKFALVGIFVVVLFGLPLSLYVHGINSDIQATAHEQSGITTMPLLAKSIQLAQRHAGMNTLVILGQSEMRSQRDATAQEMGALMDQLVVAARQQEVLKIEENVAQLKQSWTALQADAERIKLDENRARHLAIITQAFQLIDKVTDNSNLILRTHFINTV